MYKTHSPRLCKRCIIHPDTIPTWNSYLPTAPHNEKVQPEARLNKGSWKHQQPLEQRRWLQWVLSAAGPWQRPRQELQRPSKKQPLEQTQAVLCDRCPSSQGADTAGEGKRINFSGSLLLVIQNVQMHKGCDKRASGKEVRLP